MRTRNTCCCDRRCAENATRPDGQRTRPVAYNTSEATVPWVRLRFARFSVRYARKEKKSVSRFPRKRTSRFAMIPKIIRSNRVPAIYSIYLFLKRAFFFFFFKYNGDKTTTRYSSTASYPNQCLRRFSNIRRRVKYFFFIIHDPVMLHAGHNPQTSIRQPLDTDREPQELQS
jgi:hypothetical protein